MNDYLPIEQINLSYLIEEQIIALNDNEEIIFLDTSRIGKSYLDLNADIIEEFSSLESLILINLRSSIDCSKMLKLTSLKLGMAHRKLSIYIAENDHIKEFEILNFDPNSKEHETTKLLIHPDQIGDSLISPNIEKEYINNEGYNMILVSVAPPGHKLMKNADKLPPKYIWRFEEADLGDVLSAYWNLQPEYFTKFATLEDCPSFQRETYLLLKKIEEKVQSNFYFNNKRLFDIKEIEGSEFEWREFHDVCPVPDFMYRNTVS